MPKMKTHRGAAKRFKITGTGKIRRRQASLNHFLGKKSSSRITKAACTAWRMPHPPVRRPMPRVSTFL